MDPPAGPCGAGPDHMVPVPALSPGGAGLGGGHGVRPFVRGVVVRPLSHPAGGGGERPGEL